jgi:tRNA-splicing endonuclease subunit Sen34
MVEELIWLAEKGAVDLFPEKAFIDGLIEDLTPDNIKSIQLAKYKDFETQKHEKMKLKQELIKANNKSLSIPVPSDLALAQSLFVGIANTPEALPNYELFKSIFTKNTTLQQSLLDSLDYNRLNFKIFKHLKDLSYFLAPGLRFGGKFIAYPGDPLRYHAHLIVNTVNWNENIGLVNIVSGGRLATGVKKIWLIASEEEKNIGEPNEDDDDQAVCFSVEWAGFG